MMVYDYYEISLSQDFGNSKRSEKLYGFLGRGSGGNLLWGRNARKIIQWMIFSEGRAEAPDSKEWFPPENSSG